MGKDLPIQENKSAANYHRTKMQKEMVLMRLKEEQKSEITPLIFIKWS